MSSTRFATASRLTLALAALAVLPAALAAFGPVLQAQAPEAPDPDTELGESPERYAQVKVLDGAAVIRKGDDEETLTRGTPVAEGDVVESRGRGVLQLGDGTRIAFGPGTRFRVAALFAERKDGREVLLRLDQGRLRIRVGGQSDATIRVDTPSGSGTVADGAEATLEVGREDVLRFRVHSGRTGFSNDRGRLLVRAGERLTVYSRQDTLDRVNDFNTYDEDEFDHWAEPFLTGRRGESAGRVPREIRYYADDLDGHGRWVYVEECQTYCWTPNGVAAEWRPYYDGRWAAYAGGMTWVSSEPWGYVTYHHGRWGWGAGLGWYWIPGVYYSPAWVAWHSDAAFFGWAPLGYSNRPCNWGYGPWGGAHCWNIVNINYINARNLHYHVHNDGPTIGAFTRNVGSVPAGPRGPWFRGRMMVTPAEFRNPEQVQRMVAQPAVVRARLATYDQGGRAATGRVILRREGPPAAGPRNEGPARGFEQGRPHLAERPILRDAPQRPQPQPGGAPGRPGEGSPRTGDRPQPGTPGRPGEGFPRTGDRPQPTPAPRIAPRLEMPRERQRVEERLQDPQRPSVPRQGERREEPARETPAPRREERRLELPRERPSLPDRRSEPPRETARPEPRPVPREAPRQESRPEPRMESRPAAPARQERQDRPERTRDNKERP